MKTFLVTLSYEVAAEDISFVWESADKFASYISDMYSNTIEVRNVEYLEEMDSMW